METVRITKEQLARAKVEAVVVVEAPGHGKIIVPSRTAPSRSEPTDDGSILLHYDILDAGLPEGTLASVTETVSFDVEDVPDPTSGTD